VIKNNTFADNVCEIRVYGRCVFYVKIIIIVMYESLCDKDSVDKESGLEYMLDI